MQQVAIVYVQFQSCARDVQFRNRPGKLATAAKLRKLPKSAEYYIKFLTISHLVYCLRVSAASQIFLLIADLGFLLMFCN